MSWQPEVDEINKRRARARLGGGPARVARQRESGRGTIRDRLDRIVDPDSFVELGALVGETEGEEVTPAGYVAGVATIDGRTVAIGGEDFTVKGGAEPEGESKIRIIEGLARELRIPLVLLHDGAGGNIENTIKRGYTRIPLSEAWATAYDLLGRVPVTTAILGSVAGGSAGRAMLAHFSTMVAGNSELFAAGPPLVRRGIGREISKEELGGASVHVRQSGAVHNEGKTEHECLDQQRRFLSYMPSSVWELPPYLEPTDTPDRRDERLLSLIPRDRVKGYDMRKLLRMVLDDGDYFEIQPHYGKSVITALSRMNGHVVGVLASNPMSLAGALDGPAADKQGHFMELCDQFHIPMIYFVDVPGFMVGPEAELQGTIHRGMRAAWIAATVTVPIIQVFVRRCYGLAGFTTGNPKHLKLRLAWPSGEWGGVPIEGGVAAAFRRVIEAAPDPAAKTKEIEDGIRRLRSPFPTAEVMGMEDLIDPRDTRPLIIRFLETIAKNMSHELGQKTKPGVRP